MVFSVLAFISAGIKARMKLGTLEKDKSMSVEKSGKRTHELM